MGNSTSSEENQASKLLVLELFTRSKIANLFLLRCVHLLSQREVSALASRLNITTTSEPETSITNSDLAYVLQLASDKEQDILLIHGGFSETVKLLTRIFKVLGSLPFLRDAIRGHDQTLTIRELVVASTICLGRIKRVLGHKYDYSKLVFIAFAIASAEIEASQDEKSTPDPEKSETLGEDDQFVVEAIKTPAQQEGEQKDIEISRRIRWDSFAVIKNLDEINVNEVNFKASGFARILTLFLIISSIPKKPHNEMQAHLHRTLEEKWTDFERCALTLIRYFDVSIEKLNIAEKSISYVQFQAGCDSGMSTFIFGTLSLLVERSIFSSILSDGKTPTIENHSETLPTKTKRPKHKFEETRLINEASVSLISLALRCTNSSVHVDTANLVQLYNGSQSGFSIRSLELKIFKWQAPTIFLVSGKRLKQKAMDENRRYQQFDLDYPRHFLSNENPNKSWQNDLDRITYAVYVNVPWRSSNKKNFGDDNSVIMCLLPRFDFYKTRIDPVLQGQLIYFSNVGMGVGFGNDQPLKKNTISKYLPGNVSLTIEANLEFAIFRHIRNASAHTTSFFEKSLQADVTDQDFEDRFVITDLEVWGVGSTKELDEQRKQWEWEEKQAKARQSINIRSAGEDRAFLEMAGLIGNHGLGGSI